MTATAMETIEHLDFAVPCSILSCQGAVVTPRPAVSLLAVPFPCCLQRDPICAEHMTTLIRWQAEHGGAVCTSHHEKTCLHLSWFEPL